MLDACCNDPDISKSRIFLEKLWWDVKLRATLKKEFEPALEFWGNVIG